MEKDHGGNLVQELVQDFHRKARAVYMDGIISSIQRYEENEVHRH